MIVYILELSIIRKEKKNVYLTLITTHMTFSGIYAYWIKILKKINIGCTHKK